MKPIRFCVNGETVIFEFVRKYARLTIMRSVLV